MRESLARITVSSSSSNFTERGLFESLLLSSLQTLASNSTTVLQSFSYGVLVLEEERSGA